MTATMVVATAHAARRAAARVFTPVAMPQVGPVYVHPGHLGAAAAPASFVTILGSCVAVCLYDKTSGIGGLNHFLLPEPGQDVDPSPRYAECATEELLRLVLHEGAKRDHLVAHLVGGASVLAAFKETENHLGKRNVAAAREILGRHEIRIGSTDVGGTRGRKLLFSLETGSLDVRMIGA